MAFMTLATVVTVRIATITASDITVGSAGIDRLCWWANSRISLTPMKARISASPVDR